MSTSTSSSRRSKSSSSQPPPHRSGPLYISPIMTSPSSKPTSINHQFDQPRATSPSRVRLHAPLPTPSIRFSINRSISPRRSVATAPPMRNPVVQRNSSNKKRTCLCSPTTHPGSFRCALHKNGNNNNNNINGQSISYSPSRLNMRRSAMTNSLVRIGTVEGDLVKRALAALIRPSSHQLRRRGAFQPRLSRLSVMSKAQEEKGEDS